MTRSRIWVSPHARFKSQNYHKITGLLTHMWSKSLNTQNSLYMPLKQRYFGCLDIFYSLETWNNWNVFVFPFFFFSFINLPSQCSFCQWEIWYLQKFIFIEPINIEWKLLKLWETNFNCTFQRVTESVCRSEIACIRSKFAKQN